MQAVRCSVIHRVRRVRPACFLALDSVLAPASHARRLTTLLERYTPGLAICHLQIAPYYTPLPPQHPCPANPHSETAPPHHHPTHRLSPPTLLGCRSVWTVACRQTTRRGPQRRLWPALRPSSATCRARVGAGQGWAEATGWGAGMLCFRLTAGHKTWLAGRLAGSLPMGKRTPIRLSATCLPACPDLLLTCQPTHPLSCFRRPATTAACGVPPLPAHLLS